MTGIIRTLWSLLPQPSLHKQDEMVTMDRERGGGFLPGPGPGAVTEMGELGPSSLGHIYREGSVQSIWRSVLGGISGAGSTGL